MPGAWSNRVFRLRTDEGLYAVKELRNPWADPGWRQWLHAAWTFEQLAFTIGVAMPTPISNPLDGSCLAWVDVGKGGTQVPVRVHQWVQAASPGLGPVTAPVAAWAGKTLAALHSMAVRPADREIFPVTTTGTADRWPQLLANAQQAGVPWATLVRDVAPAVADAADLARAAGDCFQDEIMTHGDIDQKNLLLSASTPLLCDWDVAAPLVPRRELADVAVSLAAWERADIARTLVLAYRTAGGDDTPITAQDLGQSLMINPDWIAFIIERATGGREATSADVAAARQLAPDLLTQLPRQVHLAARVTEWLIH